MTTQYHDGAGAFISAEAFIDLGRKVDRIHDKMDRFRPIYKPVGASLVIPAAPQIPQVLAIPIYPSRGRVWNILKVVFGSVPAGALPDIHTALAGVTADVYSGDTPDLGGGAVVNAIISTGVASVTNITKHVDWCASGEQLFALLYGVTAGQQIIMAARVAEYPVEAVEALTV